MLFAISVAALALLLYLSAHSALEAEVRAQITTETNLLLFEYREDGLAELLEEIEERIDKAAPGNRLLYVVQNPQGKVIFDKLPAQITTDGWRRFEGEVPQLFHFTSLPQGYAFGVGKDLIILRSTEQVLAHTVGLVLAAALVIGLMGGFILSRRTLAQLRGITKTARAVGDGRLSQRIPVSNSGDELDQLARTLNRMLDHIEQLMSSVRHVSTGIAHDLRTPLARLRNRLESLRSASIDDVQQRSLDEALAETDTILQIFTSMLRLAEVESGTLKARLGPLDFSALLLQLTEAYRPLVEETGGRLSLDITPGLIVHGDAGLLQQLVANLLENAMLHAGPAALVKLTLTEQAGEIYLKISDQGPGIPAGQRRQALQPFERLRDGAGSAGFGLALVAAIARLHDAELQLMDNQPGLICQIKFA